MPAAAAVSTWSVPAISWRGIPPTGTPTPGNQRALRLALEYLAADPARNVSLDELAAVAGIGKFPLVRLFRDHTGLPPHALQLAHRIRLARRRLEDGATIADAAVASGFADQSHLHRHFVRTLGMTPRAYQQRARAAQVLRPAATDCRFARLGVAAAG
ncbi:MAG: hypothetical protein QOE13_3550 [Gaiellaceae bacterium]|nr:hypothetical protein [Gaiellaceae bacterium]